MSVVGPRAFDAIVAFEVTDERTYERRYQFPTWPGGASGVTVGIGFDCGYETAATIRAEFGDLLSARFVDLLCGVAGITGAGANHAVRSVAEVVVPWDVARHVFSHRTLPRYIAATEAAFQNCAALPPDAFGALVSLVYNRGASMDGDRRLEMRQIRDAMAAKDFAAVPGYIRAMKRLWADDPALRGLLLRRDAEAALFEDALRQTEAPEPEPATVAAAAAVTVAASPPVEVAPANPFLEAPTADELNAAQLARIHQQDQT